MTYASGKTYKQEAETSAPLLESINNSVINKSVISLADYIIDEPIKDLPTVAAEISFSETFVSNVSGCLQPISQLLAQHY
jgi:hypothetical protein